MATAFDPRLAPIWPLPVERYHAMIEAGILGPDDRVELLEGVIVEKVSKNPPHSYVTRTVLRALDGLAPEGWFAATQDPITLSTSEPEPDVALIRGDPRDYRRRHPGALEVGLVVEVSDSSLDRDRVLKKRIYAQAGIPRYWIIDVNGRRLEAYSSPRNSKYAECAIYQPGDSVPVILDGEQAGTILLSDLLP